MLPRIIRINPVDGSPADLVTRCFDRRDGHRGCRDCCAELPRLHLELCVDICMQAE